MHIFAQQHYASKAKAYALVFVVLCITGISDVFAENLTNVKANPERCVALNEGQVCFQNVTLSWQTDQIADYCLFEEGSDDAIHCWQNTNQGQIKIDFESSTTKQYNLTLKKLGKSLASTFVEVTWVYSKKKKRRTSWRLF
jgi:hypothetical protein